MSSFRPGEHLFCFQSGVPFFAPIEVLQGAGRPPYLDQLRVRYLDDGSSARAGQIRDESIRQCHRDSPELRAWWQLRAEYASLVHRVILLVGAGGIEYPTSPGAQLPEVRERDRIYALSRQAAAECEALHPVGRAWSRYGQ